MARRILKWLAIAAVAVLGVWALWPPAGDAPPTTEAGATAAAARASARHVLTIFPGSYVPGVEPPGYEGRPLRALAEVARDFERLFPDTRIEFVNVPSGQREWLVTQLAGGQAPDILSVEAEDVWVDVHKGWYVPLDEWLDAPNPYVAPGEPGSERWWDQFKYQTVTRGKIGPDGQMWCVPIDMVETGIFYNKRIFAELGLTLPETWAEFLALQQSLADAGYTPMAVDPRALSDWGVDLLFDQLYRPIVGELNLRTSPAQGEHLANYLDTGEIALLRDEGYFTADDPRYVELWRLLRDWRRFMPRDLSATSGGPDVVRLFVTERAPMFWSSSNLTTVLANDEDMDFEFGVFYFPPITGRTTPLLAGRAHPVGVIGGAATQLTLTNSTFGDTGDPATSERLRRAVAFLQFLCAPQNAGRVINEAPFFLPNIEGVPPAAELEPFDEILRRPYVMAKWSYTFDLRFMEVQQRMMDLLLNDPATTPQLMAEEMGEWIELSAATARRRQDLGDDALREAWRERAAAGAAAR